MTKDTPIFVFWYGAYGERRWITFLLSGLNIVYTDGNTFTGDAQSIVIHVVSTDNRGLPRNPESLDRVRSDIRAGKKVGLVHLSDEWFRSDTGWYKGAAFVLKFYYCSFITHPAIMYIPLGYPEHSLTNGPIRLASQRSLLWSFCGQRKYSRIEMLSSLEKVTPHKFPQEYVSQEQLQTIVNDTVFSPCPMGNTTPDTWRFYETLEAGCIPIVEKRWTIDYFARLFFDACPIPRFHSWAAAARWIQNHSERQILDTLQAEIQLWWTSEKTKLRDQISDFVLERFAKYPDGSLVNWTAPYKGIAHTVRWTTELCRYSTPRSLAARGFKQLGLTAISERKSTRI